MKRFLAILLATLSLAAMLTGCVSAPGGQSDPTPEPTPTPVPFTPNVWTGEKNDQAYSDIRATAIMINNISSARPQRGLSQASILFESKVEGGICTFRP